MNTASCETCGKSKAPLVCGLCQAKICKNCTQFLAEDSFLLLPKPPTGFENGAFCDTCYATLVIPELEKYEALLLRAKGVMVFTKSQSKETRLIKRLEKTVIVSDCKDYDEAVLSLAFQAAELNYNSIIDMDLKPEKIKIGTYQSTLWSGTGMPANVTQERLVKDRSIWHNPN